jgi:rhomboid protease GluP
MSNYPSDPYPTPEQPVPPQGQSVRVPFPTVTPVVTYVIVAVTVAFFLLQKGSGVLIGTAPNGVDWVTLWGAQIDTAIRAGQIWRFITPILLHGSILHIGFNMYALYIFGLDLERSYGHGRFLALYLLTGFSGNVISFLFSNGSYSIGASTAIFGLIAGEGIFLYQNRKLFGDRAKRALGNIIFVAVANLLLGLSPGIDNWGHIGGLLGGLIFAWFAGPVWVLEGIYPTMRLVDRRTFGHVALGAGLVVLIFGALAVYGMSL